MASHAPPKFQHVYLDKSSTDQLDFDSLALGGFRGADDLNFQDLAGTTAGTVSLSADGPDGLMVPTMEDPKSKGGDDSGLGHLLSGVIGGRFGTDAEAGMQGRGYFWQLTFYRPYFNVTSSEVLKKLLSVFLFWVPSDFWDGADPNTQYFPDMYGPVWVAITWILALLMSGNTSSFLGAYWAARDSSFEIIWHSDLNKITMGIVLALLCVVGLPSALWLVLSYYGSRMMLASIVSLMGYAWAPFVPAALLCMIPVSILQWLFLLAGAVVSFHCLRRNMRSEVNRTLGETHRFGLWLAVGVTYFVIVLVSGRSFFPRGREVIAGSPDINSAYNIEPGRHMVQPGDQHNVLPIARQAPIVLPATDMSDAVPNVPEESLAGEDGKDGSPKEGEAAVPVAVEKLQGGGYERVLPVAAEKPQEGGHESVLPLAAEKPQEGGYERVLPVAAEKPQEGGHARVLPAAESEAAAERLPNAATLGKLEY